ncbi:MAG: hypothetical protein KatS3mg002_1193 [Candidatus Woesearchaeota archaeon]|nr:MAG: hypothetical protein KatS3mg002_1193 [Candidatus Woesearchaeota archaeon]
MREYSFYTKNFKIHTSEKEIKDLLLSWILISIAFAILKTENIITDIISKKFVILIIISGITVGIAFIIHELAHKIVAQKYNCWAEFRADITMLIIALLMSFTGFLFIAPGAVIISGNVTKKQNGIYKYCWTINKYRFSNNIATIIVYRNNNNIKRDNTIRIYYKFMDSTFQHDSNMEF